MFSKLKERRGRAALLKAIGADSLPSFPAAVNEALRLVRDSESPMDAISRCVEEDPGVSVPLLRVANSAAYGQRHPARSVRHAVMLLGRAELEALLLFQGVARAVAPRAVHGFQPRAFWGMSARRAAAARAIAEVLDPSTAGESFTAALLQDMAMPLLVTGKGQAYGELLLQWRADRCDLAELERDCFGWSHDQVAGWLCDAWEFPGSMTQSISTHHGGPETTPLAVRAVALLGMEATDLEEVTTLLVEEGGLGSDRAQELLTDAFARGDDLARRMVG